MIAAQRKFTLTRLCRAALRRLGINHQGGTQPITRLSIPEPHIEIYTDGFDGKDSLGRKDSGRALSDLVDRIEEPMVIALDGGWGTGKSFFLKCWVGAHLQRAANTTQTVYFDAFANDFMDEPLVSLMACLLARFEQLGPEEKSKLDKAKDVAWKLAPAALRVGASLATFGASNHVGDMGDAAVAAVNREVQDNSADFWRAAQERQGVMEEFRTALDALTKAEDGTTRKLVIVVDELDRCRPDYALALLEIIKHFFAVDHVHFVLGVNMRELENSVRARYGAGINAGLYLQKFVTLTMGLPETIGSSRRNKATEVHFHNICKQMGFEAGLISTINSYIKRLKEPDVISLRSLERLVSIVAATPAIWRRRTPWGYEDELSRQLLAGLIVMKAWFREPYIKALNGTLRMEDITEIFEIPAFDATLSSDGKGQPIDEWEYHLNPTIYDSRNAASQGSRVRTRIESMREFSYLIREELEVFSLN